MNSLSHLHLVAALTLLLTVGGNVIGSEDRSPIYRRDVEFLLAELPRYAGHFFRTKGIDWVAVSNEFIAEIGAVTNDAQHYQFCLRLMARLKDGHARLTDLKITPLDESNGRPWTGPRVHLLAVGERVFVAQALGSAVSQGIKAGMEVLRVDNQPAREWLGRRANDMADQNGYSTAQQALYAACHWGLADWSGTSITFDVVGGQQVKHITIVRSGGPNYAPAGPVFPPAELKQIGRHSYGRTQNGFGYIHLRDVPGNLPEQLDTMLSAIGDVPGLILDMRANGGGGCDHAAVFGRFIPEGQTWRYYQSSGAHRFGGPTVVIVDAGTRSAGETVAGILKEDGRAYMIGDSTTAGMSSSKKMIKLPSGLFSAYFSVRSNMGRFNEGRGIEGIGVPPHELVAYEPEDLVAGVDTQIRRAEELLKRGLPAEAVPFHAEAPAEARPNAAH